MLKPDPTLARQLPADGPLLLWRTGANGRREALALTTDACSNPSCECRDLRLQGWLTGEELLGASSDGDKVRFVRKQGTGPEVSVLVAALDVDTGALSTPDGAPPSQPWALAWLEQELDPEFLSVLRARFAAARSPRPRFDWREADWSWWKPGEAVSWFDLHPDDAELAVEADGARYEFADFYCAEPGCLCEEVSFHVARIDPGDELVDVGLVSLNPKYPTAALLEAHGQARVELGQAWAALVAEQPVAALLMQRRDEVRSHAEELHRLFGAPRRPTGRNDPCPCGSGLKFKKCCLGKA